MKAVTGGAGFIGSRLAEELQKSYEVKVIDNLSSGTRENLPASIELLETDINTGNLSEAFDRVDTVFHFAANPRVHTFPADRDVDFRENLEATKNVLDACIDSGVEEIVFASSSVVYGEDAEIPTPESHCMDPISMYAATKAGAEHMCQVYSQIFGLELTVLRYANIVGPRNRKGVIHDFVEKLREDPGKLEILGNGEQKKSYLYVSDAVEASLAAWNSPGKVYNIGSRDSISVDRIADIVAGEMDVDPEYSYTGGRKGWKGDVPEMRLSVEKLEEEGWEPVHDSETSVRKTAKELVENPESSN